MMYLAGLILGMILLALYFADAQWFPLRHFCRVFGHRWYFIVSFPTIKSGEVFCKRCGKVEYRK